MLVTCSLGLSAQRKKNGNIILNEGWTMQSVLKAGAGGEEISSANFHEDSWYKTNLPTTVIAVLLKNKVYDFDPFYANNLSKITGPEFDTTWWFRKSFSLPPAEKGKNISLILHGINYRASVWLNGELIADDKKVIGPFRIFEFDITKQVKYSGQNILAIEIKRPFNPNKRDGDLAIDYADWIHYPADYNAGIVNDVEIQTCDKVAIRHPMVDTKFDLPSLKKAHLQVYAELANYSGQDEDVVVKGMINGTISFQQPVHLKAGLLREISFTSDAYPQLTLTDPKLWWPWQYGDPALNNIQLTVVRNGKISSQVSEPFGIREVSSELINNQSRKFFINGKPILLRGAAWSPDIFQRRSAERQEQEIKLVRDMNMNLIRSEGKMEDDHFYDLCDRYGLLVMTGWMCCGAWQYPERWDSVKRNVAMESQKSVMYWLRNKACLLVWLNGSDRPPYDTTVEKEYLQIENDLRWPNPILSTADASKSKVSGFSGVKMNGPYDWVPPIYWETDSNKHGGAWSFATEISPGPSIPPYESLVKFIPEDSLTVNNSDWLYHCGTMQFANTGIFNQALDGRYGVSSSIREFVAKAQAQNYEGHRAMMESFGLNKYNSATGVVQWMLSNPWPSLIWHTYDYYLYPAGTYFGIKKSLEPLHIQYSYKTREVSINNSTLKSMSGFHAKADLYDAAGNLKFSRSIVVSVARDSVSNYFPIPETGSLSFLRLELMDQQSKAVSVNWYWLSPKSDSLAWSKSKWYYTPQSSYADFSDLWKLAPTALKLSYKTTETGVQVTHSITVMNTGKTVSFFVHLRALKNKGGEDILPVIFEDNYLLLAPGEKRTVHCSYLKKDAGILVPYITASAWNLDVKNSQTGKDAALVSEFGER